MDRIPVENPYDYLKRNFKSARHRTANPSANILGFSHGADGTSHLGPVCDILLGSFRYWVNDPKNEDAAMEMFPTLLRMMWRDQRDGNETAREFGLCFRALNIDVPKYQAEYDALETRLQGYLNGKTPRWWRADWKSGTRQVAARYLGLRTTAVTSVQI